MVPNSIEFSGCDWIVNIYVQIDFQKINQQNRSRFVNQLQGSNNKM